VRAPASWFDYTDRYGFRLRVMPNERPHEVIVHATDGGVDLPLDQMTKLVRVLQSHLDAAALDDAQARAAAEDPEPWRCGFRASRHEGGWRCTLETHDHGDHVNGLETAHAGPDQA
jgi:hypothetical protein